MMKLRKTNNTSNLENIPMIFVLIIFFLFFEKSRIEFSTKGSGNINTTRTCLMMKVMSPATWIVDTNEFMEEKSLVTVQAEDFWVIEIFGIKNIWSGGISTPDGKVKPAESIV